MARPRSRPDLHLLTKVSTWYHVQDQTQQEIAKRLRISRPTVSRLLQEAQSMGIVRVTIAPPEKLHIDLETQLEAQFALRECHVVDVDAGEGDVGVRREIGQAAAAYMARTIAPNEVIGLAWGTTLSAMVRAVSPLTTTEVRVVQILGGVGPPDAEAYAGDLVRRLARRLGASPVLLPAPGIVASADVRDVLRVDPHVRTALRQIDALETVYVGIGSINSNAVLQRPGAIPTAARSALISAGAVGDIALRFFNAHGRPVRTALDDRVLGATAAQLKKIPRVVALAGGRDKVDAIRAALRGRLVNVLITDHLTAQALQEEA